MSRHRSHASKFGPQRDFYVVDTLPSILTPVPRKKPHAGIQKEKRLIRVKQCQTQVGDYFIGGGMSVEQFKLKKAPPGIGEGLR